MSRCFRCQQPASGLLTYDHAAAEAYLDDARGDEALHEGIPLCRDHAARFTAPRGWSLLDRRTRGHGEVPQGRLDLREAG